jgi:RNA polymerase sigma-70 factor (ECF subfamily)
MDRTGRDSIPTLIVVLLISDFGVEKSELDFNPVAGLSCRRIGKRRPEGGVMSASLRTLKLAETDLNRRRTSNEANTRSAASAAPVKEASVVSDLDLVAQVKTRDRRVAAPAFAELVRRHQRGLLRLVMRLTRELPLAEDIVQESFIKAYEKIELFEGRASFKSWLFQIGLNTAKNRFRARSPEEFTTDLQVGGVDPGVKGDISRRLRAEVDRLPERQRIAISLRVFEDLSFKEIAQIMNCPYDTAKANYRHALLKLRETFEVEAAGGELEQWSQLFSMDEQTGLAGDTRAAHDMMEVEQ